MLAGRFFNITKNNKITFNLRQFPFPFFSFLRRDFVRDLAKSATVEIQREREAFHLGNNSKNLTTRGKIMALNTEAESLKSVTLEAKKLAEKIQGQQFKINQFYR